MSEARGVLYLRQGKKKEKLFLGLTHLALRHEGVWESRCIGPRFHDLGISSRSVALFPIPTGQARGSVVVKALCYKPEGREFETR
jgi:hypothetical protein